MLQILQSVFLTIPSKFSKINSLNLYFLQMNVKSIFEIVTGNRDRKKSSSTKTNQWLKAVVIRACILAVFTIIFLYFRFRLNKTPPLFSGEFIIKNKL